MKSLIFKNNVVIFLGSKSENCKNIEAQRNTGYSYKMYVVYWLKIAGVIIRYTIAADAVNSEFLLGKLLNVCASIQEYIPM